MIHYAIAIFLIVLAVDLITDYRKWLRGKPVRHSWEAFVRVLCLTPAIILLTRFEWYWFVVPAFMVMFWYWLLFDGFYNTLRGYNWWFTGSDDVDDAHSDNLLQELTLKQHIALKVAGCVLTTIIYIILCYA